MNLGRHASHARQISDLVNLYNTGRDYHNKIRKWQIERTRWSVTISEHDPIYPTAHSWFVGLLDDAAPPRAVEARMASRWDKATDARVHEMRVYYDQTAPRAIQVAGHTITVELVKPGQASKTESKGDGLPQASSVPDDGHEYDSYRQPYQLKFFARSREGQLAVLDHLRALVEHKPERRPALWLAGAWGGWQKREDLPPRSLESVVLAAGQMERLVGDLDRFLRSEAEYNRRGIPWHRGYLLHGPPGTGKTSTPRALAAHFGLDLWYAPLGDMSSDFKLLNAVSEVRPRSILLLEDIDVYQAARTRDDEAKSPHASMAGLLNATDGVATPHGLITFITSNRPDVIDPALVRPGRVDLQEEIGLPDAEQADRLFATFYDRPMHNDYGIHQPGWSAAQYTEVFKRHMDSASDAQNELRSRTLIRAR